MTIHYDSTSSALTYAIVMDAEYAEELQRLVVQERILNKEIAPLFPHECPANLNTMKSALDLACGTAGWALDLATEYPHLNVRGTDISSTLLAHATDQAHKRGLTNVTFETMDFLKSFPFPDNSFDLVNVRLLVVAIYRDVWPRFLKECLRILRPGGILRLTETDAVGPSNQQAFEDFFALLYMAAWRAGYGFSPDGKTYGMTALLEPLLHQAGYKVLGKKASAISYAQGSEYHADMTENFRLLGKSLLPFFIKTGVISELDAQQSYQHMVESMNKKDFSAIWYFLTVWAMKPL